MKQTKKQSIILYSKSLSILSTDGTRGIEVSKYVNQMGQTYLMIASRLVGNKNSNLSITALKKNYDGTVTFYYNDGEFYTKFNSVEHFKQTLQYKILTSHENIGVFGDFSIEQVLEFISEDREIQKSRIKLSTYLESNKRLAKMNIRALLRLTTLKILDERTKEIVSLEKVEQVDNLMENDEGGVEAVDLYSLKYLPKIDSNDEPIEYQSYRGKTIKQDFILNCGIVFYVDIRYKGLIKRMVSKAVKKNERYLNEFNLAILDGEIPLQDVNFADAKKYSYFYKLVIDTDVLNVLINK